MNLNASAGKSVSKAGKSFTEWCEKLELKATRPGEPQLFAAIASVFFNGGTIEITRPNKESFKVTFGDDPVEVSVSDDGRVAQAAEG